MSDQELVADWLAECRTQSTKDIYANRIKLFQAWYKKPLSEFLGLKPKEMRHLAITYQSYALEQGMKANSLGGVLSALGSFCMANDMPLVLRGKRVRMQMDLDSHRFTTEDLAKMFEVGNTQEKAILATLCSLGWEATALLELSRQRLESLVVKAREQKQEFTYFLDQRKKTGAARIGVLNPLALEWLSAWFKGWKGETVFHIVSWDGVSKMLKRLARQANVTTTGRIHSHSIRKWVMSGLSHAGFNEFQIKFVVGKSISVSDATYLLSLQQEVEEKYPKAYEQYLRIHGKPVVEGPQLSEADWQVLKGLLDDMKHDRVIITRRE
jgi:hypothetical protein